MARSSTSFKPGNRAGKPNFEPGNKLAVTHGVYSPDLILPDVPAKIEELYRLHPYWIDGDREAVKSLAYVCVQEDRLQEWMDADPDGRGRLWTSRGGLKEIHTAWKDIQHAKREWMKVLAMGAGPRSQYAQAMSGAGKNMVEVRSGLKDLHRELQ